MYAVDMCSQDFFSENKRQIMDSRIDVVKNICKLNNILVITVLHGTAYTHSGGLRLVKPFLFMVITLHKSQIIRSSYWIMDTIQKLLIHAIYFQLHSYEM